MRPAELKYTPSHEWVRIEEEKATVGITDFAVEHLSDLTFLDLPDIGDEVTAGEPFGEIESVKAVAELNAPLSGTVVEVNADLQDNLESLSEDAFGAGWLIQIELSDPGQIGKLLTAEAYEKVVEAEESD